MSECRRCTAPSDDAYLCRTCTIGLRIELTDVPALLDDLDVTRTRQDRLTSPYDRSRGSDRHPLPFRPHVGEVVWDLHNTLSTWAHTLGGAKVDGLRTAAYAHWLKAHLDGRVRQHPDVAQLVDEVTDAIHRARHVIDRPLDRRMFLGVCGDGCAEELWGLPWNSTAICPACGAEHAITARQEFMREQARCYWGSPVEIAGFLRLTGVRITDSMIRGFAFRGRLEGRKDAEGHMRYRIRDVLEAIDNRYQHQQSRRKVS